MPEVDGVSFLVIVEQDLVKATGYHSLNVVDVLVGDVERREQTLQHHACDLDALVVAVEPVHYQQRRVERTRVSLSLHLHRSEIP